MKFINKAVKVIKKPNLIIRHFKNRKKWHFDVNKSDSGLSKKVYKNYNQYIKHQISKLDRIGEKRMNEYDRNYRRHLKERLQALNILESGMAVLCLAARIGTEVKSFIDLGCFAVGIDLNPGKNNKYVVHGDFHKVQYANKSVNIVFCNSIDHSLNPDQLFKETRRVLKFDGYFIIEIGQGAGNEKALQKNFEAIDWEGNEVIIKKIKSHGFELIIDNKFNYPWSGVQFVFKKI